MGETRVDLLRLLEDLRDAYPGAVEETIVTEIVANALDSGAREVALSADAVAATLTAVDDGKGMGRPALSRYHDLAVTDKRRGKGIGFAGVGIKLGLLVSDEVVTETRRRRTPLATSWRLSSRIRAPWRWVEAPGLLEGTGTAVRLYLSNPLSRLLDVGFLEETLLRHFQPLFDPAFDRILEGHYPEGVRFRVNGRLLGRAAPGTGRVPLELRIGRQRKPSGIGYLVRDPDAPEDERGIAVSTLGKVIRRGWEWLGLSPAGAPDVKGLLEVPALAEVLTLNKADFIRSGPRGATFLAYRKALQEAVSTQLEAWGEGPEPSAAPRPRTRSLERDLQSVLADLSEDYPLLATLVERRRGGQRRLPLGSGPAAAEGGGEGVGPGLHLGTPASEPGEESSGGGGDGAGGGGPGEATKEERERGAGRSEALPESAVPGGGRGKQPGRYGLHVRFERRPGDPALGRLVESTVWVNEAHPAYRRAAASRSEGYHVALAVAMSLAAVAVEPAGVQRFVEGFLARWGEVGRDGRGRRRGPG